MDLKQRLMMWHEGSTLNETKKRHRLDQYLIGGKEVRMHGVAAYIKKVEERIAQKPPEINIAKITRSFYNPTKDGQPIANVFRLNYIKNKLDRRSESFSSEGEEQSKQPLGELPYGERYDLDKFSLKQIDQAFKVYTDTLNMIKQGERMILDASQKRARENEHIPLKDKMVIEMLHKDSSPKHREIAEQLENPFFLALVKLIRLYIKFN